MCNRALFQSLIFCLLLPVGVQASVNAAEKRLDTIVTPGGTEIQVEVYPAKGEQLLIWQPHEIGLQTIDHRLAQQLEQQSIEVWLVNLAESYFLPNTESSLLQVDAEAVQALITSALSLTPKRIYVGGSGRGALPILRGVHAWQTQDQPNTQFGGIILLSPKLFVETPDPGLPAELMPIVTATNAPIFLLQPNKSPWIWKLDQVTPALEKSGSDLYLQSVRGMRDRFYFRPDATSEEIEYTKQLPHLFMTAMQALDYIPAKPRRAGSIQTKKISATKKARELKPYKGSPTPPQLNLKTLDGTMSNLHDYKGQVVLVNFWASWCPPCVHEMPSMERLTQQLKSRPFTILGVNMAEKPETIQHFLDTKVNVSFPILLDSDGQALKSWGVFAFPTSYVVDKKGNIRYALFGSIEWDSHFIVRKIEQLLDE